MTSRLIKAGTGQALEPLTLESEAQQVLDELWKENLTPFKLNVGKITKREWEHTIHFYDSRMRKVHIPLTKEKSFRDLVREIVLARVAKLSGPLTADLPAHN